MDTGHAMMRSIAQVCAKLLLYIVFGYMPAWWLCNVCVPAATSLYRHPVVGSEYRISAPSICAEAAPQGVIPLYGSQHPWHPTPMFSCTSFVVTQITVDWCSTKLKYVKQACFTWHVNQSLAQCISEVIRYVWCSLGDLDARWQVLHPVQSAVYLFGTVEETQAGKRDWMYIDSDKRLEYYD